MLSAKHMEKSASSLMQVGKGKSSLPPTDMLPLDRDKYEYMQLQGFEQRPVHRTV